MSEDFTADAVLLINKPNPGMGRPTEHSKVVGEVSELALANEEGSVFETDHIVSSAISGVGQMAVFARSEQVVEGNPGHGEGCGCSNGGGITLGIMKELDGKRFDPPGWRVHMGPRLVQTSKPGVYRASRGDSGVDVTQLGERLCDGQ